MKKLLLLISLMTLLTGCVAVPVYDSGYDYPTYGSYPYGYIAPSVSFSYSSIHGGYGKHHGGGHWGKGQWGGGHRGGDHWGGGRR